MNDPMIGMKIALTGLVLFVFCTAMYSLGKQPPVLPGYQWFAPVAAIGLFTIPVGMLIQIWI